MEPFWFFLNNHPLGWVLIGFIVVLAFEATKAVIYAIKKMWG
jgi:hypothetical protein